MARAAGFEAAALVSAFGLGAVQQGLEATDRREAQPFEFPGARVKLVRGIARIAVALMIAVAQANSSCFGTRESRLAALGLRLS